jgi:hypothetical protein
MRTNATHLAILRALGAASGRFDVRVVHYAVMSNHIHLICEAETTEGLRVGLGAAIVRLARELNRTWKRSGKVFDGRFHARALSSPREVWIVLAYVLQNALHHGILSPGGIDPFSSSRWFEGWTRPVPEALLEAGSSPLPRPRTWLLLDGWKLAGTLDPMVLLAHDGTVRRPIKFRKPARSGSDSPARAPAVKRGAVQARG